MEKVRLDKFLWSVRLYKTRSQAAEACKKGRVLVNGQVAKASKEVREGDKISVKYQIIYRVYRIKQLLDRRVGAKLVDEFIEEITPESDLMKLKVYQEYNKISGPHRVEKGRPTKKERRQWEKYFGRG